MTDTTALSHNQPATADASMGIYRRLRDAVCAAHTALGRAQPTPWFPRDLQRREALATWLIELRGDLNWARAHAHGDSAQMLQSAFSALERTTAPYLRAPDDATGPWAVDESALRDVIQHGMAHEPSAGVHVIAAAADLTCLSHVDLEDAAAIMSNARFKVPFRAGS
ncbi:MAG: hypothetical protein HKL99_07240 [Burkholderiales bacterium]|nr:hypothetical protein [Burkholderiales bacterium]